MADLAWPPREPAGVSKTEVERQDVMLLLETVHEISGLDFRGYAYSSIRRRVGRAIQESGAPSVSALHSRLRYEPGALAQLTRVLTVHTTSLFRDPVFFATLRERVLPVLHTYPFLRIWIAGCSTGEEVYSLAILLQEHGLYEKCRIYATDLSDQALETAKNGVYPLAAMQDYSRNYQLAGGQNSLSDYYTADQESVVLRRSLRANVVFGTHNLVSDASFNEFHLILCRNVIIYFGHNLQARVHRLFHESLISFGFLGLGKSESLRFTEFDHAYEAVDRRVRLFRKIK